MKRKKFSFWKILPKIAPWGLAIWGLSYSELNIEQSLILVSSCLVLYFIAIAVAADFCSDDED